jgi:glycosyltransferase involved in cell wall biosynthesis
MGPSTRVLFCRSNTVAPDPRVAKEANALSKAGYRVQILAWDRAGTSPENETIFVDEDSKVQVPVTRLRILSAYGRGMQNLPSLLRWQLGILTWMWKNRNSFDLIHACDFDTILPSLFISRLFRKKVVYDIFDFYSDHLRRTPQFIKWIVRRLDIWAINRADGIILADETRKVQIKGSHPRRVVIVYNSPEDWLSRKKWRPKSASKKLIVIYIGTLTRERGLFHLIDVIKNHKDWQLDIGGYGPDDALVAKAAARVPNIKWHGRTAYKKTMQLSYEADVLIATFDSAIPNHRFSSPNKLYEAMMLSKPIVVSSGTHIDGIIHKYKCGLVVKYGDLPDLERALALLANNHRLANTLGKNGRKAYEDKYSWAKVEKKLLAFYKHIVA